MIAEMDLKRIEEISRRYGVGRVLLFGSSLRADNESRDIDLAVEGLEPRRFFRYYGELMMALSKPVDLVDLEADSGFNRLIRQEGVALYG